MHHEPGALEQVIHFFLFVAGAGALGVCALAVLESFGDGRPRIVRPRIIGLAVGVFLVFLAGERIYHALA